MASRTQKKVFLPTDCIEQHIIAIALAYCFIDFHFRSQVFILGAHIIHSVHEIVLDIQAHSCSMQKEISVKIKKEKKPANGRTQCYIL